MAKVSHPREQQFILDLIRYYRAAELKLIKIIAEKEARGTVTQYSKSLLAQVQKQIDDMNKTVVEWSSNNLPPEYTKGIKSAVSGYSALGVEIGSVESFSKLNTRNIDIIVRNTTQDLVNANNFIGRKIQDDVRDAGLKAIAQKELTGQTVRQTKQNLINKLIDQNVMAIKTRNGRNMNISSYAEVVARSTSREAQNRGLLDTVTSSNRDLVKMSEHLTTCPVCGPLQGRVYSISGTSTEYPPLEVAHGGVHANIHPNCRHVLMPYVPELDEDAEKVKAFSNRSFDIDNRSKSQIDNYNKEQKKKAELNRDRRQWERYKTMMPDKTPKTLSAFRKSKKSNSKNWQELQSEYRSLRKTEAIYKPKPKPQIKGEWGNRSNNKNVKFIEQRFNQLSRQYPLKNVPIKTYGDTLTIQQKLWDENFELNKKEWRTEKPNLKGKHYDNWVKRKMIDRPTSVNASQGGVYQARQIGINLDGLNVDNTFEDSKEYRRKHFEKQKKRVEEGRRERSLITVSDDIESTMIHEYGHAIIEDLKLDKNSKLHKYYRSLSEREIDIGLSSYASTNEEEFFAEAFTEMYMDNPRPIAVKFKKLLMEARKNAGY